MLILDEVLIQDDEACRYCRDASNCKIGHFTKYLDGDLHRKLYAKTMLETTRCTTKTDQSHRVSRFELVSIRNGRQLHDRRRLYFHLMTMILDFVPFMAQSCFQSSFESEI
jgi:hypothetical protein